MSCEDIRVEDNFFFLYFGRGWREKGGGSFSDVDEYVAVCA
jgi:hypothetical protein